MKATARQNPRDTRVAAAQLHSSHSGLFAPRRRLGARILLGVYLTACFFALTWPGYDLLGNRIEPFVLGLPLSLMWNVGWVLGTFAVLIAYHLTGREEG